jgi:catechol 2,3-dioxygenase-like lactoylglutathione lyase family enzyme
MPESSSSKTQEGRPGKAPTFSADATSAVVRYQVQDLDRAVAFYTRHLGFEIVGRPGPVAIIRRGDLNLVFSGPGSSGSRPIPGGRRQEPGGWNRIVLYLDEIHPTIAALKAAGARFRNELEVGPGGKQIQVDDPDGNPIELHEAPKE